MEKRKGYFDEYDNLVFHPYNILLVLVLLGVSALFLALTAACVYSRVQANLPPIRLPDIFIFNTLVLLASSWTLWKAKQFYLKDDTVGYQKMLVWTIILTLIFLALQSIGWYDLIARELLINNAQNNSISYLYVLSGLHFAHVLAGLPFLSLFYRTAHLKMKEPVSVLVYFSDPSKKLKLRLLTIYWHFLDGLWVYLVVFFSLNYFFQ